MERNAVIKELLIFIWRKNGKAVIEELPSKRFCLDFQKNLKT